MTREKEHEYVFDSKHTNNNIISDNNLMCDVCIVVMLPLPSCVSLSPVQLPKELFGVLSVPRKDPFEILLSFLLFIPRVSDISSLPLISFSLHLSVPCRASF